MSGLHDDVDLGHTIAGWTGCAVVLAGCTTVGVAMCAAWPLGIRLGLAVIVLGGLVTWALHLAGWGKPSGPRPPEQWDWRVKDPMTGHDRCLACRLAGRPSTPVAGPETGPVDRPAYGAEVLRGSGSGIGRKAATGGAVAPDAAVPGRVRVPSSDAVPVAVEVTRAPVTAPPRR